MTASVNVETNQLAGVDIIPLDKGTLNVEPKKRSSFTIKNPTDSIVAFKLKRTSPEIIKMGPAYGYINPKDSVQITILAKTETKPCEHGCLDHVSILLCRVPDKHPLIAKDFWQKGQTEDSRKEFPLVCESKPISSSDEEEEDSSSSEEESSGSEDGESSTEPSSESTNTSSEFTSNTSGSGSTTITSTSGTSSTT